MGITIKVKGTIRRTIHRRTRIPKSTKDYSFHTSLYRHELEDQLDKIKGGYYVPYENYDRIRRADKKTPLEAAAGVAGRVYGTIFEKRPSSSFEDQQSIASIARRAEIPRLKKWAEDKNMMLESSEFEKTFKANPVSGAEHQVILDKDNTQVLKRRQLWGHETYFSILQGIVQHNKIFPEAAYTFKGFMETEKGVNNTSLMPVYTQPFFKELTKDSALSTFGVQKEVYEALTILGSETEFKNQIKTLYKEAMSKNIDSQTKAELDAANWMLTNRYARSAVTLSEIITYMSSKGFEVMKDNSKVKARFDDDPDTIGAQLKYINYSTGMVVSDLHSRNFMRLTSGDIVCFDPQVSFEGMTQEERIKKELEALI